MLYQLSSSEAALGVEGWWAHQGRLMGCWMTAGIGEGVMDYHQHLLWGQPGSRLLWECELGLEQGHHWLGWKGWTKGLGQGLGSVEMWVLQGWDLLQGKRRLWG